MQASSRFQAIRSRFSFRRASSASSRSTSSRNSFGSSTSSQADTINSVIFRQPSIVFMEEEKKSFGSELSLLEPRPIVYWGGLEERMGSL